jgi:hypothetical protein
VRYADNLLHDPQSRGLPLCLVRVEGIRKGKPWPTRFERTSARTVRMLDLQFSPRVLWVPVGTQLVFRNDDPDCEHNVRGCLGDATRFNFAVASGATYEEVGEAYLTAPGRYRLKDDCCGHMHAALFVVEHPYHSDPTPMDGHYRIEGIPPGTYEVLAWHEGLGLEVKERDGQAVSVSHGEDVELRQTVTVVAGATARLDFTFPAPDLPAPPR